MRPLLVLDSNVIFDILLQRPSVMAGFVGAMTSATMVYLCPFVHYEVTRGFLYRPHPEREHRYHELVQKWHWDEVNRADWNLGALLWADCQRTGRPTSDADLMIAAFAQNRGAKVITADLRAFANLPVPVENWRTED